MMYRYQYERDNELYHYGIPGMKWGVRRYQNKDGSLTPAGKKQQKATEEYNRDVKRASEKLQNEANELMKKSQYYKLGLHKINDADHPKWNKWDEDSDTYYQEAMHKNSKCIVLRDNYVKDQQLGSVIVSSAYLAPMSAIVAGKLTKNRMSGAKRAAVILASAIGAVTVTSLHSTTKSNSERRRLEKELGIKSIEERMKDMR